MDNNGNVNLKITGIQSNLSAVSAQDGSCLEIINLRNRFGEWTTIYPPKDLFQFHPEIENWHIHVPSDGKEYYWGITIPGGYYSSKTIIRYYNGQGGIIVSLKDDEEFLNMLSYGDLLIINTSLKAYYMFYSDGNYTKLPEIPTPRFSVATTDRIKVSGEETNAPASGDERNSRSRSEIIQEISNQRKKGRTQGHTFFTLAFKTTQGNYIQPTSPVYHYIGAIQPDECKDEFTKPNEFTPFYRNIDGQGFSEYRNWYLGYFAKPQVKIKLSTQQLNDLNKYSEFIESIVIFMSDPQADYEFNTIHDEMLYKTANGINGFTTYDMFFFPNSKPYDQDLTEIFSETKQFFKFKEIVLSDLSEEQTITIDYESPTGLDVLPPLNTHTPIGKTAMDYNSRIHLANIINKLSPADNPSTPQDFLDFHYFNQAITPEGDHPPTEKTYILVKLRINNNDKYVLNELSEFAAAQFGGIPLMVHSPIITYPDTRAISATLIYYKSGTYYKGLEFNFKKHSFLNIAYYLHPAQLHPDNKTFVEGNLTTPSETKMRIFPMVEFGQDMSNPTEVVEDPYYNDPNRIQISEILDPLSWPAINSYNIGPLQNQIIDLNTMSIPTSEGQFGEYPLFVFSSRGVFALQQGSESLYASIKPINQNKIKNSKTIYTDYGIVFLSEKGIGLQQGRELLILSGQLDGLFNNPVFDDEHYKSMIDGSQETGNLKSVLFPKKSKLDLSQGTLAYNEQTLELFISFPDYTLIYSFETKVFYKTTNTWKQFINRDGELIGINKEGMFQDLNTEPDPNFYPSIETLIVSNPMNFNEIRSKSINEIFALLYGENNTIEPTKGMSLAVFGSNNLREWKLFQKVYYPHTDYIRVNRIPASSKFYVLVLASKWQNINLSGFQLNLTIK